MTTKRVIGELVAFAIVALLAAILSAAVYYIVSGKEWTNFAAILTGCLVSAAIAAFRFRPRQ